MSMFKVLKAPSFQKKVEKLLDTKELEELDKFIINLKSGNITGKPITYQFFREKKINAKRIYFLIYEDIRVALLVNASNKKHQQETIDEIKYLLPEFKKIIYEEYNQTKTS